MMAFYVLARSGTRHADRRRLLPVLLFIKVENCPCRAGLAGLMVFRSDVIPLWTSVGEDEDDIERFDLNIPWGSGMTGNPVFSRSGELVGLLDVGEWLNRRASLILGVGVSAKPLFEKRAAAH